MGKRIRNVPLYVRVTEAEHGQILTRMEEAGTSNMAAFIRKMALNGYVIHVDLAPVKELVSLQRRCANNLNQVATNVNTHGGTHAKEIAKLKNDYESLWEPLSTLINKLSEIVRM